MAAEAHPSRDPNLEYDPFDHAFLEDPYPHYAVLREHAPVARNERLDLFALSRFDDVWNAVHDPQTYSSAQGISLYFGTAEPPQLIEMDPPRHTAYRKLVSRTFTQSMTRVSKKLRSFFRSIISLIHGKGFSSFG